MKRKTYTADEAAKLLGVQKATLYTYVKRGKLERVDGDLYDAQSVDQYLKNRKFTNAGKLSAAKRKENEQTRMNDLYDAIIDHFIANGAFPVYEDLVEKVGVVKSSVKLYVRRLHKDGRIEIYRRHIYPVGLRDEIKELAKKYVHNKEA